MPSDGADQLKITSPRLEQDEFELTPAGAREADPSGRTHARSQKATRARGPWANPTPAVETEDTSLDGYAAGEEVDDA